MSDLKDKVVIITGAGSGLGRATALLSAQRGAKLALVDLNEASLQEISQEIAELTPEAEVITFTANVANEDDVTTYVQGTVDRFGRVDGFFNNAGIEGRQALTENFTLEEFQRVLDVNLNGVFLGMEKVLPLMREQGSGAIVNTASVGGIRGVGNQAGYSASKHGVVGLTRNAAVEYGDMGVRINAVAPGAIWTTMVQHSFEQMDPTNPEAAAAEFVKSNPTQRYGQPEEVATVVAFLLSDDASYVNAAVIPIDGGQSAKY